MSLEDNHEPHDHHDHDGDNYDKAYNTPAETADASEPQGEQVPSGYGYWRSLRELEGKGRLQTDLGGNELPPIPDVVDPLSRRNFFQLMGASMGLAGVGALAAGCRYEKEEIVPLARRPEDQIPGATLKYATACELGGVGHALLATSFEGRPIKLDGNTEHPFASGSIVPSPTGTTRHAGCSTFVQASILHLYDPDRSQAPQTGSAGSTMVAATKAIQDLAKSGNVRVLSEGTSSPTIRRLQNELPSNVKWHEYEPISWDNERLGSKLAFNRWMRPLARLDRAATIVALDCDLFVEHPAALRYCRDFSRSRRFGGTLGLGKMNRLWSVESTLSQTGATADHRLSLRSELGLPFAMALDAALGGGSVVSSQFLGEAKIKKFLDVLVEELKANKGKAVVIAGRRQPPEVHALVARINEKLDAQGNTLDYIDDPDLDRPSHLESITALAKDMAAGHVDSLLILGGNPVYDAPADLDFGGALGKVKTSIHLSDYVNETSQKTTWHVPRAHFLEAWGDTTTWDGTMTIAQPLIAPLFGGLSSIQALMLLLGKVGPVDELVKETLKLAGTAADQQKQWRAHVHDGFANGPRPPQRVSVGPLRDPVLTQAQKGSTDPANPQVEVTFHYSAFSYDGRFANNAWLQETPDFLTKVVWDNYAIVGVDTAKKLHLENNQMMKVKVGDREIDVACCTQPGQARYSIALVLGGGRTAAGRVGGGKGASRTPGWDTYKVRQTTGFNVATATVTGGGDNYELASTQEHWDIRTGLKPSVNTKGLQERIPEIIKITTAAELARDKSWKADEGLDYWDDSTVEPFGKRRGYAIFQEHTFTGHRWAMAIDLSTCVGCNACMVACQNENNVPVVGRWQVMHDREMHWIRVDRYFSGTPEEPTVHAQPLPCMQCENAPCEQVCPVGATSTSDEGLNDQAYNRCIGTRYCANNCPYKVRRFNFLDWNKEWREARNKLRRLLFNPEVTVRMRGVMEKCTYCVQRIQNAKIHAKAVRRTEHTGPVDAPLPDGEIVTACQAACPTEAIVFGDLADPNSRVSRLHNDPRHYDLLEEFYTKPRTKYLARVRNPNPKLAMAAPAGEHGGH